MLESSKLVLEYTACQRQVTSELYTVLAIALCMYSYVRICIINAALSYKIIIFFCYLGKEIDIMIPGQHHRWE